MSPSFEECSRLGIVAELLSANGAGWRVDLGFAGIEAE